MEYYKISACELGKNAKVPLIKMGDSGEVFYEIALEMINEIKVANAEGRNAVFIVPVGPVGQYPIFTRLVNEQNISLKNTYFINMDEYLTDEGEYIDCSSDLSFRGFMEKIVYSQIKDELVMPQAQRIFPDPKNPDYIGEVIKKLGGVDVAFGGIGINGHLAFNEPQTELTADEFAKLTTRVLDIAPETRTTNCIGDLGGALEDMPKKCITIGISEILSAKKIRIGVFRDWHRAVVRRTAYGEVTSAFPATLLQNHADAVIYLNENSAKQP